jgi:hypothetical protein
MWGFQQSFRRGLERAVEKVLEELGLPGLSTGYLIGVLQPGGDRRPLCVEPEDGPLVPANFESLATRATELYREDPESSGYHSHPLVRERRRRLTWERAFCRAIKEIVERESEGLECFVGLPTPVEQHLVYPAVAIPAAVLDLVPTLNRDFGDDPRFKVDTSIVHAAIFDVLRQATQALHLPDPGEGAEIGVETDDVLRAAVGRLTRSAVVLSGNEMGDSLSQALNRLSTLRYERRVGIGRLVLAQRDEQAIDVDLGFRQPIRVRETRALRKLLELSGRGGPALLTDGDEVYGLGRLNESYDPASERVFELLVLGDGTWELRHLTTVLVTVEYGTPRLPQERLGQERFSEIVRRVFDGEDEPDVFVLWGLVTAAAEAEHGTMIVISAAAAEESERLSSQALPVEPTALGAEAVVNVTQIDGAILVDSRGNCHGLGVILDGTAEGGGDRSRGARYNSAVKYLASMACATVIVIVSEDGMINLLPDLRPRVPRALIGAAMDDLRGAAAIEPVHPERFYKAFDRIKELRFYLSQEQCDEANQLCVEHWDRRRAAGATIWVREEPLAPDPRMDDSYLLD